MNLETIKELSQIDLELMKQLLQMEAILVSTKIKEKELMTKGTFKKRISKKFKRIYNEIQYQPEHLVDAVCDLRLRETIIRLNGLGGSKPKSIEEILKDNNLEI